MIILSWLVVFLLGLSFVSLIAQEIGAAEKIGFSFPMGMGIQSIIMFLLDVLHFPVNNNWTLLVFQLLLIALFEWIKYKKQDAPSLSGLTVPKISVKWDTIRALNFTWLLLISITLFVVFAIVFKTLAWPVFIYDSLTGYDFLAKAIAREGTIHNSIFDPDYPLYTVRCLYPPLVPYNFAYAHITGLASSKIVDVFYYLSIYLVFYAYLKRHTTHLAAAFFSLLLAVTPEFAAFSALSSPNPPTTFYVAIGILSLIIWYNEDQKSYLHLGIVLIAFGLWTRTESIIFAIPGGVLILLKSLHQKEYQPLIAYSVITVFSLFIWQWYTSAVLDVHEGLPLVKTLYWDPGKLSRMMKQVRWVTFKPNYYGITVFLFLVLIALNAINIIKKKDQLVLLSVIFSAWGLYMIIFYQIKTDYMPNQTTWITSGYRRGFFYFLPPILYYCANNRLVRSLFRRIEVFNGSR